MKRSALFFCLTLVSTTGRSVADAPAGGTAAPPGAATALDPPACVDYHRFARVTGRSRQGAPVDVVIGGNHAFTADRVRGLQVLDLSAPRFPVVIATLPLAGEPRALAIEENHVVVAALREPGRARHPAPREPDVTLLHVIDVADSGAPRLTGSVGAAGEPNAVTIAAHHAYVATTRGLLVVDVSRPVEPEVTGVLSTSEPVHDIAVRSRLALGAHGSSGLLVVDISDPSAPDSLAAIETPGPARGIAWRDEVAVVVSPGFSVRPGLAVYRDGRVFRSESVPPAVYVIDVSKPRAPRLIGSTETPGYALDLALTGEHAYITGRGLQMIDLTAPWAPRVTGHVGTGGAARGVAFHGAYALVAHERRGLSVVHVANPVSPTVRGRLDTPGYAHDVAVSGDTAYLADGDSGLAVVDVSRASSPVPLGTVQLAGYATAVCARVGLVIVAAGTTGFHVLETAESELGLPRLIATIDTPTRVVDVEGDVACVADGRTLTLVDVSDPGVPELLGRVQLDGRARGVSLRFPTCFVATEDSNGGLEVVDVTDPLAPVRASRLPPITGFTGVAIRGNRAYLTDRLNGLGIADITDPRAPEAMSMIHVVHHARDVVVDDAHAYVAGLEDGIQVIALTGPDAPTYVGGMMTRGRAYALALAGERLLVADGNGLAIVPVQCP